MVSSVEVVLGSIAFVIFWVLVVFPAVPFLPTGRTAGSLLGAMLMVIFQVITPDEAYASIDLSILGLLFGTMLVSTYLERADMFKYLGMLLSWKSLGAKDLLCRICLVSAISSALFTNDTSCVVLTEFVLKLARQHDLPPHPFLLALASSANIGSSATPISNPLNLVIAVESKISFGDFLVKILPAMLVGVAVNAAILLSMFWKVLSIQEHEEYAVFEAAGEEDCMLSSQDLIDSEIHRVDPSSLLDSTRNLDVLSVGSRSAAEEKEEFMTKWKRKLWKTCVYLVTIGMLISLLMGLNMSWTAITAALVLVVLDFQDARESLEKVSYSLLIFFCGMFITVDGFNKTGIPSSLWDLMEPYAQIDRASGIAVLALVILVLSNLASNVPTVLLLGARVATSAGKISAEDEKKTWLVLAWVSTVAGNLSILGSAANLTVCEKAQNAPHNIGYKLSFWRHIKFGVPSTLVYCFYYLFRIYLIWSLNYIILF